jgi:3-hydroxyacyl-CoA dehydrogenase
MSDIVQFEKRGYGFPPRHGGPMFYADTIGLSKIYGTLQHFAATFGSIWKPSALLEKLATAHQTFASLETVEAWIKSGP